MITLNQKLPKTIFTYRINKILKEFNIEDSKKKHYNLSSPMR